MFKQATLTAALAAFAFAGASNAATVAGNTTPVNDGDYDQDNLIPLGTNFGENINRDSGKTKGIGNSFTSHATDATQLNAFSIYVQDRDANHAGDPATTQNYIVTVGAIGVSGGFISPQTETASAVLAISDGEYLTFTLDNPLVMAANTKYGFILNVAEDSTWELKVRDQSGFSGGARLANNWDSDGGGSVNDGFDENSGRDVDFHLDISAVPEPSSLALLGLGGLLIARRRRG